MGPERFEADCSLVSDDIQYAINIKYNEYRPVF